MRLSHPVHGYEPTLEAAMAAFAPRAVVSSGSQGGRFPLIPAGEIKRAMLPESNKGAERANLTRVPFLETGPN